MYYYFSPNELYHHGIKGQKWGIRRFRNSDGSYTSAWRKRRELTKKKSQELRKEADEVYKNTRVGKMEARYNRRNPNGDFDEYIATSPSAKEKYKQYTEDSDYRKYRDLERESEVLGKGYVKRNAGFGALGSAVSLAAPVGLVASAFAPKGKKAVVGALGAIGSMTAVSALAAYAATNEKVAVQKKYGIR